MRDHVAPNPEVLRHLNRLSDLVFVLARGRGPAGGSTLARPA
jgi:cob(I)alamin adenosyltransferase